MPKTRPGDYARRADLSLRNRFGESVTLYDDRLGAFVRCAHEAVARDPAEVAAGKPFHVVSQLMFFHGRLPGSAGLWHNQPVGPEDVPGFSRCMVDYATALELRLRIGGERRILVTGGSGRTRAPSVILVWLLLFRGLSVSAAEAWLRLAWRCQRPTMAADASTTEGFPNLTRFANLFAHIDRTAAWVKTRVARVTRAYTDGAVLPAGKSALACAREMADALAAGPLSFEQVTASAAAAGPEGATLWLFDQSINPTAFRPLLPEAACTQTPPARGRPRLKVAKAKTSSASSSSSSFSSSTSPAAPSSSALVSPKQARLRDLAHLHFSTLDLETLRRAYYRVFGKQARGTDASKRPWFIDTLAQAALGPAAANVASLLPSAPSSPKAATAKAAKGVTKGATATAVSATPRLGAESHQPNDTTSLTTLSLSPRPATPGTAVQRGAQMPSAGEKTSAKRRKRCHQLDADCHQVPGVRFKPIA